MQEFTHALKEYLPKVREILPTKIPKQNAMMFFKHFSFLSRDLTEIIPKGRNLECPPASIEEDLSKNLGIACLSGPLCN